MAKLLGASGIKKRPSLIITSLIILLAVATGIAVATAFSKLAETDEYFVLNQEVPSRSQITVEMLEPREAVRDQAPPNALSISEVQSGKVYAQYPLNKGDILSASNVSGYQDISTGIPDNWVVTNFPVPADNAVGGRIVRGTYFDIMVTTKEGTTYPFVNVLALDTTVSTNSLSNAQAIDGQEAQDGQTEQYYVGMSPENAAKLQHLVAQQGSNIRLVMSPRQNEYQAPDMNAYKGIFTYDPSSVVWPGQSPSGEVTDYTFSPVERDEFGRPIEGQNENTQGNARIPANGADVPPATVKSENVPSLSPAESPSSEASPAPSESASPSPSPTS